MSYDFLAILQEKEPTFSKGQKRISRYITESYDKAAFMTANCLGKTVGVSESTVVRFAVDLGFDGYPSMQKAMQEMGITPDTLDAYVETWKTGNPPAMRDGDLNQFWPQTPKAIHHTFYNWSPKQDSGHYMMVEGEDGTISQALAAKIGDEAFKAYCQGKVDMEWVDSLAVSYCLWNEEETTGEPYWLIQYHDLSDVFNTRGWVKVDAKTGEILLLELDLFSNG